MRYITRTTVAVCTEYLSTYVRTCTCTLSRVGVGRAASHRLPKHNGYGYPRLTVPIARFGKAEV